MCPGEEKLSEFAQGCLSGDEGRSVEAHLAACAACRTVVGAVIETLTPNVRAAGPSAAPARWRYAIHDELGAGGMGVVYAAYDVQLDRRVALKVLRARADAEPRAAERLLREARALAKLTHPNVVTLFDAGTLDGEMFIAMELVEGGTLRKWLASAPRTPDEILDVFAQAGEGLAAAHAAGIVHCDFKPDNVLLGKDGRPRVTDFGLARVREETAEREHLARAGGVVGTPAYISPEQVRGVPADARSDQFTFCVALFEALVDARPFAGATLEDRAQAAVANALRWPATARAALVTSRVRAVLERGLRGASQERFPTMRALLDALARARRRRSARRLWVAAAVLLGVVAASIAGGFRVRRALARAHCASTAEQVSDVWNDAARGRLSAAFAGSSRPFSQESAQAVARKIDRYAREWREAYQETCEAGEALHTSTPQTWRAQRECLDGRLVQLRKFLEILTAVDADKMRHSAQGVDTLGLPKGCATATLQATAIAGPDAVRFAELISTGRALNAAGKYADALRSASEALALVEGKGHADAEAKARLLVAEMHANLGQLDQAEKALYVAVAQASRVGDELLAAGGWVSLSVLTANHRDRAAEAIRQAEIARGLFVHAKGDAQLELRIVDAHANALRAAGKQEQALEEFRQALTLAQKVAPRTAVARAHFQIGQSLDLLEHYEEALGHLTQALEIWREELGPNHYETARGHSGVGIALAQLNRAAESVEHMQKFADISRAILDPNAPPVGDALVNLAGAVTDLGEMDRAEKAFLEAKGIYEKSLGPKSTRIALANDGLAFIKRMRGDFEGALVLEREAVNLIQQVHGAKHPETVRYKDRLAQTLLQAGRRAEALETSQQVYEAAVATMAPDTPALAGPTTSLGRALLANDRPAEALRLLRKAEEIDRATPTRRPADQAVNLFALAQALWATNGSHDEAMELAQRALEIIEQVPLPKRIFVPDVAAWIAERRPRR